MRTLVIGLLTLGLSVGTASAASAEDAFTQGSASAPAQNVEPENVAPGDVTPRVAIDALSTAGRVLAGDARPEDPSASVALRDLWLASPSLDDSRAQAARQLLARPNARPTDGPVDQYNDGYTVPSTQACGTFTCLHWVPTSADAPPSAEWVNTVLATMENTYNVEVNTLGYRAPRPDGVKGGDGRLDIYLKNLGPGLYGYCAPENRAGGRSASGFCVLDNDYAPTQFPGPRTPLQNLQVTAAHEFFHSVQYAYDFTEDRWMLESTATWMEERVADDVNDNRQYLASSQLAAPFVPLDAYSQSYSYQYGNWIFWEYLTQKYGVNLVRDTWQKAASKRYSVKALNKVLKRKGGLSKNFADFAAANTVPTVRYEEAIGVPEYTPAAMKTVSLSKSKKRKKLRGKLDHLTSGSVRYVPKSNLSNKKWKLKFKAHAAKRAKPMGRLTIIGVDGSVKVKKLKFNRRGNARIKVPFSAKKVNQVILTMANTSTRYKCGKRTVLACAGRPKDDNVKFSFSAKVSKKKHKRRKR